MSCSAMVAAAFSSDGATPPAACPLTDTAHDEPIGFEAAAINVMTRPFQLKRMLGYMSRNADRDRRSTGYLLNCCLQATPCIVKPLPVVGTSLARLSVEVRRGQRHTWTWYSSRMCASIMGPPPGTADSPWLVNGSPGMTESQFHEDSCRTSRFVNIVAAPARGTAASREQALTRRLRAPPTAHGSRRAAATRSRCAAAAAPPRPATERSGRRYHGALHTAPPTSVRCPV